MKSLMSILSEVDNKNKKNFLLNKTFGIISPELKELSRAENAERAKELESIMGDKGMDYHKMDYGYYGGHKELHSYIIDTPTKNKVIELGNKFDQESIIYGSNGHYEMIYSTENVGEVLMDGDDILFDEDAIDDMHTSWGGMKFTIAFE